MLDLVAEQEKRQHFLPLIVITNNFSYNNILNHRELKKAKAQFQKLKPTTLYQNLMSESAENHLKKIVSSLLFSKVFNPSFFF